MLDDLLKELQDGKYHSGVQLGEQLGVTRAAVWKAVLAARKLGLGISSSRSLGYRLERPLELLDAGVIRSQVYPRPIEVEVFSELASSNDYLMTLATQCPPVFRACFVERQTAGRGRRGRQWISGIGDSLTFSVSHHYDKGYEGLQGYSLAIGASVVDTLRGLGAEGLELKWPNDVLFQGRKLAGILIELSGEAGGGVDCVIGLGLNLQLAGETVASVDQPAASLGEVWETALSRNTVASALLSGIYDAHLKFGELGFSGFKDLWQQSDGFTDKKVALLSGEDRVEGIYRHVDDFGRVVLTVNGVDKPFSGGELSLRLSE